jgi:nucleoside-diphosphate-sugar epimerase
VSPEVVIHAGCSTEFVDVYQTEEQSTNCINTKTLITQLNELSNRPYLILTGAAGIYGVSSGQNELDESSTGSPSGLYLSYDRTQYIHDKKSQMRILDSYRGPHVTLGLTTVFGKNMPPKTLGFYRSLRNKKIAVAPRGGTSFLGEGDLKKAIDLCLQKKPEGAFIVSSGNITFADLFRASTKALVIPLPFPFIFVFIAAQMILKKFNVLISTFGYKYYSARKFQAATGWKPQENIHQILEAIL